MTAIDIRVSVRTGGIALRVWSFVAYPALAGAVLPAVTRGRNLLPALAALASALCRWQSAGEARCFVMVLRGVFLGTDGRCGVTAWVSTAVIGLLAANVAFLVGQPSIVAFMLLAFGTQLHGFSLLVAAAASALTLVVPFGPLLLGPSLAVLAALALAGRPSGTE